MYPEVPLQPLYNDQNQIVDNFPSNPRVLGSLRSKFFLVQDPYVTHPFSTAETLTVLLEAFGLPTDGPVPEKKRRLRNFVGLVREM